MNSHGAVNRSERHCVKECQRVRPIGIFAKSQIIANDRLCQGKSVSIRRLRWAGHSEEQSDGNSRLWHLKRGETRVFVRIRRKRSIVVHMLCHKRKYSSAEHAERATNANVRQLRTPSAPQSQMSVSRMLVPKPSHPISNVLRKAMLLSSKPACSQTHMWARSSNSISG